MGTVGTLDRIPVNDCGPLRAALGLALVAPSRIHPGKGDAGRVAPRYLVALANCLLS